MNKKSSGIAFIVATIITGLFSIITMMFDNNNNIPAYILLGLTLIVSSIAGVVYYIDLKRKKELLEYKNNNKASLNEHALFHELIKYKSYDIPGLCIKHDLKKAVITSFLQLKYQTFHELLCNFVLQFEKSVKDGLPSEIDRIYKLIFTGLELTYERAETLKIPYHNRIITGVPECFINMFRGWYKKHIDMISDNIKDILNNELYPSERTKLLAIIELLRVAFFLTIEDAQGTMDLLNGDLEKELEKKVTG